MDRDPEHEHTDGHVQHHGGDPSDGPPPAPGVVIAHGRRRLEASPMILERAGDASFEFRVLENGEPLMSFDELHERRMHLIAIRRDLTGFQHLHPRMDEDGRWVTPITFPNAGAWRVFADFSAGGVPTTLGVDVLVAGLFDPQPLPQPSVSTGASTDRVMLERLSDGVHRFAVVARGMAIRPKPYLGALGHLVVLRWGDLAFLHVHPVSRDELAFVVRYPTPGAYRCFLQYAVNDEIRTAAFTIVV